MSESTVDTTTSRRADVFKGKKYYAIITGASAGIGRAIAVAFSREVAENSVLVITGRNSERLIETKRLVGEVAPGVQVIAQTMDHSKATFEEYRKLISDTWANGADGVVLVHNAATLGDVRKYAITYTDEKEIDDYFHLNLTSVMTLTSAFLEKFPRSSTVPRVIVNITSLAAVKAWAGLGLYCTGKAARQMYLNVIAAEDPSLTVMHYSPGPVDTAMQHDLRHGVEEAAALGYDALDSGMLLTAEVTALRLLQVLGAQGFKSGDHVDYYERTTC
uniref:Sepiapterin reductase n=1 Tax=Amblyomma aureolatum TaxID=187763 RepID=A0A1E1X895_9ACAR